MSSESLYLILPTFAILTIVFTLALYKQLLHHLSDVLLGIVGYLFFLCDYRKDCSDEVIFNMTWEELNPYLLALTGFIFLSNVAFNFIHKKHDMNLERCRQTKEELEDKLKATQREYYKLCSDNIRVIFNDFFKASNGNGRVSIYKHHNNEFTLLGRYSENPQYNKRGRSNYSENEGFISLGWQKGEYSIWNIPKWSGKGKDYKSFVKHLCNISDGTLNQIGMKSRSLYIKRIENEDARTQLGIIVFEQMQETEINPKTICNTLNSTCKEQLSSLIKSMKSIA